MKHSAVSPAVALLAVLALACGGDADAPTRELEETDGVVLGADPEAVVADLTDVAQIRASFTQDEGVARLVLFVAPT